MIGALASLADGAGKAQAILSPLAVITPLSSHIEPYARGCPDPWPNHYSS